MMTSEARHYRYGFKAKAIGLGLKFDHDKHTLTYGGTTVPVVGSEARVEAVGDKQVTATRFLLAGPLALAMKKDKRSVFLTIEHPDGLLAVEVPPKKLGDANTFAHALNMYSRNGVPA